MAVFYNPFTIIEQLTYFLFIKGLDDEQTRKERTAEKSGKPMENPTFLKDQGHLRWKSKR